MKFNAACVQLNCQNDMQANLAKAIAFIEEAASNDADFITLPENAVFMSENGEELIENSYYQGEHPALKELSAICKKLNKLLLVGSMTIKIENSDKIANRSFLINGDGNIAAQYDKIHLYDVQVDGGESHKESKRFIAGERAITADMPWCKLGMTICYDVRFPHLYRKLAQSGASIIAVPSAFTEFTGKAHWHVLLRARAIENGCYIIAPAQTGSHPAGRKTYGHSLIIDPWGDILCDSGENEGVCMAEIDTEIVRKTRQQLPSLEHDRGFL